MSDETEVVIRPAFLDMFLGRGIFINGVYQIVCQIDFEKKLIGFRRTPNSELEHVPFPKVIGLSNE